MWFTQRNRSARAHDQPRFPRERRPDGQVPPAVQGPALPDEATVHFVLDLAVRIGEVQMSSGAGAADATATIIAVASAYGLPHSEVDVIFTSITVTCHRGVDHPPITSLRVVRTRSLDYTRLALVEKLVRDITAGRIAVRQAHVELNRITSAPHPYPRWVATGAYAGMAAAITVLIGGEPVMALFAALITALIDRVGRLLNRRALPFFFQQVVGGALATGGALALVASGVLPDEVRPTAAVAAAITVLLSGLSLVSTVQDAITGYNVTAAGRTIEVSMMTAGLIAGVVLALNVAVNLGLPSQGLAEPIAPSALRLPLQTVAGGAAAACFALASYATPRAVLVAGIAGATGAGGYSALALAGFGQIAGSAIAATAIGFAGGLISRRLRIPPLVVAVSGMVPLLPGLATYRALYELAIERTLTGLPTLMVAASVALALAAGVVLGEYLAQPVRYGLGRLERRISGPRLAGPLRPTRRRLE
ncbi:amino acid export carrier protein [Actinophytocola xinjiangensis]|uniref:Amino acid export carrier protein n=1 Tax=Actinophytocola xinjiangensis TaxID=485602 RepID=A0A7Z1AVZ3_9PSEU|nr:threonine/serine exporter family protein [Actinophytocola xinjiangensis]OLF07869.1 amino acid export carrier protein [Actinophytocola xinjiangensis]